MERGFIKNIIGAALVLLLVFLSQMAFLKPITKNILSQGSHIKTKIPYADQAGDWFGANIYDRVSGTGEQVGEVAGDTAKNVTENAQREVANQKDALQKNFSDSIKTFVAKEVLQVLGVTPQELGAVCPIVQ